MNADVLTDVFVHVTIHTGEGFGLGCLEVYNKHGALHGVGDRDSFKYLQSFKESVTNF